MLRHCSANMLNTVTGLQTVVKLQITLRWLLQWGSPLSIPNREVKPISADGTTIVEE